eukprot:jgi/Psemu1/264693/estExt_Genewise1Plus.C_21490003
MKFRAVGLCGADDSVHPKQLVLYAHAYPFVEFGVLFRPDKEGQPRYPTPEWVALLAKTQQNLKLAAHLCERRVDEVLKGDDTFVSKLEEWGFGRVQINATAVNGVDTSVFDDGDETTNVVVNNFLSVVARHPELEFILQKNEETRPLWEGVLRRTLLQHKQHLLQQLPPNISMLVDESMGTGVLPERWPPIPRGTTYSIGYAGGIGPDNISTVLEQIRKANQEESDGSDESDEEYHNNKNIWIDMESSLRSQKNGADVFDLDKCHEVILAVCDEQMLFCHPPYLQETN